MLFFSGQQKEAGFKRSFTECKLDEVNEKQER